MSREKQAHIKGHSFILIELLQEEKFKRFAEIGVWKSHTTKRILKRETGLEEYWAIDPWDTEFACSRTEKRRDEKSWFLMHWYCCTLMMYFPQLKVVKMTSEQASTIFPDGYFDMVYIDAVHTFEHMDADIGFWLPKVRKGGIIGGHDYGGKRWTGVKEAVDKWFGEENIKVWDIDEVWIKRV